MLIMKGSTSLRRLCWLQVNFSYGPTADVQITPERAFVRMNQETIWQSLWTILCL